MGLGSAVLGGSSGGDEAVCARRCGALQLAPLVESLKFRGLTGFNRPCEGLGQRQPRVFFAAESLKVALEGPVSRGDALSEQRCQSLAGGAPVLVGVHEQVGVTLGEKGILAGTR